MEFSYCQVNVTPGPQKFPGWILITLLTLLFLSCIDWRCAKCLVDALGYDTWPRPVLRGVQWHFLSLLLHSYERTSERRIQSFIQKRSVFPWPMSGLGHREWLSLGLGTWEAVLMLNAPAVHQEKLTFFCFLSLGSTSVVKKPWGKMFCSLSPHVRSHWHVTTAHLTVNKI